MAQSCCTWRPSTCGCRWGGPALGFRGRVSEDFEKFVEVSVSEVLSTCGCMQVHAGERLSRPSPGLLRALARCMARAADALMEVDGPEEGEGGSGRSEEAQKGEWEEEEGKEDEGCSGEGPGGGEGK